MQNTALGCSVYQYSHLSVWNLLKTQSFASRTSLWATFTLLWKSNSNSLVFKGTKDERYFSMNKNFNVNFWFSRSQAHAKAVSKPRAFLRWEQYSWAASVRPKNNMRNSVRTRGTVSCSLLLLYIWWEQPNIYLPTAPLLQFIWYELIFTAS